MSKYLDRLRALDSKKHILWQPSKPSKAPLEPFEGTLEECLSPKLDFKPAPTITAPAFDPVALQRAADRRNIIATHEHSTDRWCACGRLASYAWSDDCGRDVWRCLDCGPVKGEA
jgi:hypothetical protein